jgi:hypothetical protein
MPASDHENPLFPVYLLEIDVARHAAQGKPEGVLLIFADDATSLLASRSPKE